jgi:hypothetical protein
MSTRLWDRAASVPARAGTTRRPELIALPTELPTVAQLFGFMRDAELRFDTLRMHIEERVIGSRGEQVQLIDVVVRHQGEARVTTSEPGLGTSGNYELWLSDGETVRTYSGIHRIGTRRPVRRRVTGLDDPDLPPMSKVYTPITSLPMETLPESFIHPAGFCQNVLGTGDCRIVGTTDQASREAIVLECFHPRSTQVTTDRPDHHFLITVDRDTGVISRMIELVGDDVTRDAEVTSLETDVVLSPAAFLFTFPSDATMLY